MSACPMCECPRRDAARGECRVPIPVPQPPGCLMVELERDDRPQDREEWCDRCQETHSQIDGHRLGGPVDSQTA